MSHQRGVRPGEDEVEGAGKSPVGVEFRLAVAQPAIDRAAAEASRVEDAIALIAEAGKEGAEMVLFPESYPGPISGGLAGSTDDYDAAAPIAEAARAASCAVCWGRVEQVEDSRYVTVAYLTDGEGKERLRYVRSHPATGEVHPVLSGVPMAPGERLGLVEVGGVKFGIAICSELWIPEVARTLALEGAEILLAPAGGAFHRVAPNWRLIARARAIENGCFVALTQQLFDGEEGAALVAGPESVLAETSGPGLGIASLDLGRARWLAGQDDSMREPKEFDSLPGLLRARRPGLYGPLTTERDGLYEYERRGGPDFRPAGDGSSNEST